MKTKKKVKKTKKHYAIYFKGDTLSFRSIDLPEIYATKIAASRAIKAYLKTRKFLRSMDYFVKEVA